MEEDFEYIQNIRRAPPTDDCLGGAGDGNGGHFALVGPGRGLAGGANGGAGGGDDFGRRFVRLDYRMGRR